MKQYDVLSIGAATIDAFLLIDEANSRCRLDESHGELCIKYGEKISVQDCQFLLGGNGSNIAVGISRLGFKTALCIEIGDDEFSQKIINSLAQENIDTSHIKQMENSASSFAMGLNFKGERTLFVRHVVRDHDFNLEGIETKWVYLTSIGREWKGAYKKVLQFVKDTGAKLAFNPGTLQIKDLSEELFMAMQMADVVFVNREEAYTLLHGKHMIVGEDQEDLIKDLLQGLHAKGTKMIVITNGKKGSYVINQEGKIFHFGIYPGDNIERTGGGDAYASGYVSALLKGLSIEEAIQWGTANAGSVIEHIGAQKGLLTQDQLLARIVPHAHMQVDEVRVS